MEKIKVIVAEDHPLMRESIVYSLNNSNDKIEVVNQCSNGIELMRALELSVELPDVVLLDIDMPQMDGIEALELIRKKYSLDIKILVFTALESPLISKKLIKLGVEGIVFKTNTLDKLIQAITDLYKGYSIYQKSNILNGLSTRNEQAVGVEDLSETEINILTMICNEFSTDEIADKLCFSKNTINTYRSRLISKTNSKSICGLVVYAIRHGIFNPYAGN